MLLKEKLCLRTFSVNCDLPAGDLYYISISQHSLPIMCYDSTYCCTNMRVMLVAHFAKCKNKVAFEVDNSCSVAVYTADCHFHYHVCNCSHYS